MSLRRPDDVNDRSFFLMPMSLSVCVRVCVCVMYACVRACIAHLINTMEAVAGGMGDSAAGPHQVWRFEQGFGAEGK